MYLCDDCTCCSQILVNTESELCLLREVGRSNQMCVWMFETGWCCVVNQNVSTVYATFWLNSRGQLQRFQIFSNHRITFNRLIFWTIWQSWRSILHVFVFWWVVTNIDGCKHGAWWVSCILMWIVSVWVEGLEATITKIQNQLCLFSMDIVIIIRKLLDGYSIKILFFTVHWRLYVMLQSWVIWLNWLNWMNLFIW